jgi:hypothetical protein
MSDKRPLRICDGCGQVDDHPRHVFVTAGLPVNQEHVDAVLADESIPAAAKGQLVRDIVDTTVQQRHMDCCRDLGCPDRSCDAVLATLSQPATGKKLLDHIVGSDEVAAIGTRLNDERVEEHKRRKALAENGA